MFFIAYALFAIAAPGDIVDISPELQPRQVVVAWCRGLTPEQNYVMNNPRAVTDDEFAAALRGFLAYLSTTA
jgi:hypothetical protein